MTEYSLAQLETAQQIVGEYMQPTPTYQWPLLTAEAGCSVWVKHENQTPTGAFKVRGGLVFAHELVHQSAQTTAPLPAGLITATRGNHGQSVPYAACRLGIPVTVLVPEGNSAEKNAAMAGWGATVEVVGKDFDEAREIAAARVANSGGAQGAGWQFVPSFAEPLVRGVATYALELFRSAPRLDRVYVPIGMGSGICGVLAVRDLLGLSTEVIGVVSAAADAVALSVEQGRHVTTASAHTFADGLACRVPAQEALDCLTPGTGRAGVARIVRVSDTEVAQAVRLLYRTTHNIAEGAGAAACAALLQERAGGLVASDDVNAIVLSGGNIDADWFAQVLAGGTPTP